MAIRLTNPFSRYFTDNAALLSGGKLNFFEDDGGTTPKNTFSDNALLVANANPVILSSSGVMPDIFLDGAYRVTLENKDGVQLDEADNVNAGDASTTPYALWAADITYDSGREVIVTASDDKYYYSTSSSNLGNDPISSPGDWSFLDVDAGTVTATGTITGDTLEATGDTSAGDNAAIGWTTTEGIIITGQGSTNDITIKNDADADVITVPTGAVGTVFAGLANFSAAGIVFDDETLDEYDIGTFTATLTDGTNDATQSASDGKYGRIGDICLFTMHVLLTSLGSVSGTVQIKGLPFTSSATGSECAVGGRAISLAITAGGNVTGQVSAASDFVTLFTWDSTGGTTGLTGAEVSANGDMTLSGYYEI